jgi:hypothetical protein
MRTLFIFAAAAIAVPACAQTAPAAPGTPYRAGTIVTSAATGISFTVPDGFEGAWDDDAQGIVLSNGAGLTIGIWGVSAGTIDGVADEIGGLLASIGLQLTLAEEPRRGDLTTALFHAQSAQERGYLVAAMRQAPSGAILAVGVLGADQGILRSTGEALARGAHFGDAEAAQWAARAAGLHLAGRDGGSTSSRGGVGDAYNVSRTEAELTLCRSQEYSYQSRSTSSMSVAGVGDAESNSSDAHRGQWSLLGDLVGRALLSLESTDGRSFLWSVEETENGAVINGFRYEATPGPC